MLREGLKLARTLGVTQPLNATIEGEISPGPAVSTDDDWDAWLTGIVGTEYVLPFFFLPTMSNLTELPKGTILAVHAQCFPKNWEVS
jgi:choline dehydrogenase-like flavoprotein